MAITLSPDLESRVQDELKRGQFTSEEQLIEYALYELERQRDIINSIPAAELQALLDEGEEDIRNGRLLTPEESRASLAQLKAELARE